MKVAEEGKKNLEPLAVYYSSTLSKSMNARLKTSAVNFKHTNSLPEFGN